MLHTLLRSIVLLTLIGLPARSVPPSPTPDTGCVGCQGIGGAQGFASNGSGATLSISVAFGEAGECKWVLDSEGGMPTCKAVGGCDPIVTRSWSGLPPNTPLRFTVDFDGHTLWLQNPAVANSGSGTGSSEFDSAPMACDDAKLRTYGVACTPCGLSATTEVRCSSCNSF